jgi:hypothetical protein
MFSKVGLVEKTKGGEKEGKKANNNEIHHICVVIRKHTENCKTIQDGGKGKRRGLR